MNEDGLNGSPWYIKVLIRVGMPTAFASVLLWFLITNVTGKLTSIDDTQMQLINNTTIITQNQARII